MRYFLCWMMLLLAMVPVRGATGSAPAGPLPSNRYLLIIENSRAMQRRADGVANAISTLLGSALNGQIRAGDSLGLWTYNEQLATGLIPLQDWPRTGARKLADTIAKTATEFKYQNDADFGVVTPELQSLIADSDFLTVLIFNSGSTPISGTPFDSPINTYYNTWKDEQAKKRMPFVTLLRATKGKVTHHAVTAFPWTLDLPPLPKDLTDPPKPAPVLAVKPRSTNILAPLIISGRKPEPTNPPAPVTTITNPAPAELVATNTTPTNAGTVVVALTPEPTVPEAVTPAPPVEAPVSNAVPPPALPPASTPPPTSAEYKADDFRLSWSVLVLMFIGALVTVLGVWRMMRPRSRPRKSLITSSLDRED